MYTYTGYQKIAFKISTARFLAGINKKRPKKFSPKFLYIYIPNNQNKIKYEKNDNGHMFLANYTH